MEFVIELPVIARIKLMQILNDKAKGKGKDRDYKYSTDLYEKIEIPDEIMEQEYQTTFKDGSVAPNIKAIHQGKVLKVGLTFNELEKLEKYVDEAEIAPAERKLWYQPLMDQINQAKTPDKEDKETRDTRLKAYKEKK